MSGHQSQLRGALRGALSVSLALLQVCGLVRLIRFMAITVTLVVLLVLIAAPGAPLHSRAFFLAVLLGGILTGGIRL